MSPAAPHGFVKAALRVTLRNLTVWRSYAAASALGNVGEPLLYLIALGFGLGQVVPSLDGMSYAEFIAPGLVVSTVMYSATFEGAFGAYTRLAVQKTFEAVLATPVEIPELILGEVIWGGFKSLFGGAIVLAVVTAFGLVPSWSALGVIPLAFLSGLMFSAMALSVTALSRSYESFNYYFTLVVAPQFMFSGIFFPLARMPTWVQSLAQVLPLTHVVIVARALVRGRLESTLWLHVAVIALFGATAYGLCARWMTRRLRA